MIESPQSLAAHAGAVAPDPGPARQGRRRPTNRLALLFALLAIAIAVFLTTGVGAALAAPPAEFGGPEGSGAGEFASPIGVAIDQQTGDTYIADKLNQRVDKFGPDGEFILAWGWGVADRSEEPQTCTTACFEGILSNESGHPAQFRFPEGIAVDNSAGPSHGDVFVLDVRNHRVQKFGPGGEFLLMIGGEVNKTTSTDLCTAGDLEAGDTCGPGAAGTGPGEFEAFGERNAVAVGPDGTLYVGDRERIQKFSPAGAPLGELTFPGVGILESLAVDSAGDIYVASEMSGVRKYEPTGIELGTPRDPGASPGNTVLAVTAADELLLADRDSRRVLAFNSSGAQLSSLADPESEFGIAFRDDLGLAYVIGQKSIQVLDLPEPGAPYVLAGSGSAGEIEPTTATLHASLNPEGGEATEYHFEYDTAPYIEGGAPHGESTPVTPLPVNEVQSLALEATAGTFTLSFEGETTAAIPFDATAAQLQSALEAIAAIGAGNLAVTGPAGGPYAIEFTGSLAAADVAELSPDPTNLENGGGPGAATIATTSPGHSAFEDRGVSAEIASLQPATTYHFRLVATNKAGRSAQGPDRTFTTLPAVSIESISASGISADAATLRAELNPHGLISTYRFEYGPTGAYGTRAPIPDGSLGEGKATVTRNAVLQGLAPSTTYHFRIVAENSLGTAQSTDLTFTTQPLSSSVLLPDGRGWELVSPPDKQGSPLEAGGNEWGGQVQAAADGTAISYIANGPVTTEPDGSRAISFSQILSQRGVGRWGTEDIATSNEQPVGLFPGRRTEYMVFASDLTRGLVEPLGVTPLSPQATERTPYIRESDGEYVPLVDPSNVATGVQFGGGAEFSLGHGVETWAASPDLRHVAFTSPARLTPGFSTETAKLSVYEWNQGQLQLISQVPPQSSAFCGPAPACSPAADLSMESKVGGGTGGSEVRGAVSADGSRVVFDAGSNLFLRDTSRSETLRLDLPEPGFPGVNLGLRPQFQFADADGTRVFFTDESRLTADSGARSPEKPDLYMCQVEVRSEHLACELTDISVALGRGEAGAVLGALSGASDDGSIVYFAAQGVLSTNTVDNGAGPEQATPGANNLYRYDLTDDQVRFIATGADGTAWNLGPSLNEGLAKLSARVSPDGRYFAFMSQRALTGYDNRDVRSGARDQEVFLYDAQADSGAGRLLCASCNPTGARPSGAFDRGAPLPILVDRMENWGGQYLAASLPGWSRAAQNKSFSQPRYLSDSGRLFFSAADALVPQDSNGTEDVYEFEPPGIGSCTGADPSFSPSSGGCVALISSGASGEESVFLDASESGDDAFFLTAAQLAPTDEDAVLDVYDAHVCTAALPCPRPAAGPPPACSGDACQVPATPPDHPTPGTLTLDGPGNVVQCPKGKVKQKGKCAKKKQAKKKHKHKNKKSRSNGKGTKSGRAAAPGHGGAS